MAEVLRVERLGHRGDGVLERPDGAIYVAGALPGETVEVEEFAGSLERRRLVRVVSASAERVAPICEYFGVCGGCAVQHLETASYRAWKRDLVVTALRQAGLDAPVADLIDAHGDGRRRAVFHARSGPERALAVGFAAAGTHRIIPIEHCPILAPSLHGALEAASAIARMLAPTTKPLDIQVNATDAGLDIDVRGSGPLSARLTTALAGVAAQHNLARLTRHGELVAQRQQPTLRIGKTIAPLPPAAFLQATEEGEKALARLVLAACAGARSVADLFAGIGPFALRLAERARVLAADNDGAAIGALKRAAATPGLKPVAVETRDLFRRPFAAIELNGLDTVVFDPPRQGALVQVRELAASRVPVVVAVSCDPGTFARDARELVRAGYRLTEVTPVDQFRYAAHVEIVARFAR